MNASRKIANWLLKLLVLYLLLEVSYRAYRFHEFNSADAQLPHTFSFFESPLDVLEPETGFALQTQHPRPSAALRSERSSNAARQHNRHK